MASRASTTTVARKRSKRTVTQNSRVRPLTFRSRAGDSLAVTIGATGRTTIRAVASTGRGLDALVVRGLTADEASRKSKGFWGRLWDGIKSAANAVIDAVTFGVGGATCRPSASVGLEGGRVTKVTVGVSCTN